MSRRPILRYAPRLTHAELVERARGWLLSAKRCCHVFTDATVLTWEQPDAIGWNASAWSRLVEAKASRSDFLRDKDKDHRRLAGMGNERFYMACPGVIEAADLEGTDWGLLVVKGETISVAHKATTRGHAQKDWYGEMKILVRLARGGVASTRSAPDRDTLTARWAAGLAGGGEG